MNNIVDILESWLKVFNAIGNSIFFANINIFTQTPFPFVIAILMFGCFYFLFKLRFSCFTLFIHAFKLLMHNGGGHGSESDNEQKVQQISSFRALFTSIAGAAGLGNIAGIAVAVTLGGPGVVFWVLIAAILCMPLRFAEVYLGHKYRHLQDGKYQGGPYWYMTRGFSDLGFAKFGKFLAILYSIMLIIATYGGACSFQTNQAVKILMKSFEFPDLYKYFISLIIAIFVFIITAGGIKRVAEYCSSAVIFFMSIYVLMSFAVLIYYYERIPEAFSVIMQLAFTKGGMYGGAFAVFVLAFKRIDFANETGLGTAPSIHCSSSQENSVKEALIGMICPVIDAIFVCFVTGVIVVISGSFAKEGLEGITMVQDALNSVSPWFGKILTLSIPLVAINVMIAWSYYGMKNIEFLTKTTKFSKFYLLTFSIVGFIGGIVNSFGIIVEFGDIVNLSLIIPNVLAVLLLRKQIAKALNDYVLNFKYGKEK